MMQILDPYEPGDGGGGGGSGDPGDGGTPTGGTDPTRPPTWTPGGNGWWEFIGGVWRWMTEPPRTVSRVP